FASPWTGGTSLAVGAFALCHVSTLLAPTVAACAGAVATIGGGVSLFFQSRGISVGSDDPQARSGPDVSSLPSQRTSVGSDDSRTGHKPCDEQCLFKSQTFQMTISTGNSSVGCVYTGNKGVDIYLDKKLHGSQVSALYIATIPCSRIEVVMKVGMPDNDKLLTNEYNILKKIRESPYIVRLRSELSTLNGFSGDSDAKVVCFAIEKCERALGLTRVKDPDSPSHDLQMSGLSSVKDVETVATALLHALEVLHESKIVHRDIKPENILQRSDGSWVLADFGSACAEGTNLKKDEILNGMTEKYIAPEFLSKDPSAPVPMGREVDAWALGRTIYECFTAVQGSSLPKMEELKQAAKAKEWVEFLGGVNENSYPDRNDFRTAGLELESDYDHFTESPAWKVMLDLLTIDSKERADKLTEALGAFQRTLPQNHESRISV
ncbi:MAG: protein kinase family protein, partial [Chlamydiae bacterium]|nr:protein kinase family protein [Chlamydiota bacterium]